MITPVIPLLAGAEPLPLREALSGILGSISLVSWIFLLVSNYSSHNAQELTAHAQVDSLLIPSDFRYHKLSKITRMAAPKEFLLHLLLYGFSEILLI